MDKKRTEIVQESGSMSSQSIELDKIQLQKHNVSSRKIYSNIIFHIHDDIHFTLGKKHSYGLLEYPIMMLTLICY